MTVGATLSSPTRRPYPGANFDVVAIAASAGGLRALEVIVTQLPASFPAAIISVQHLDRKSRSLMAEILERQTRLRVRQVRAGDCLEPGSLYTAMPDWHMVIDDDMVLRLNQAAPVHYVRPSADPLFESVARACRERALAVILSGTGSDGNMGVLAIKRAGGTVIVQDPASAAFGGMPNAAIQTGSADFVLPLDEIAPALVRLVVSAPSQDSSQ